MVKAKLKNLWGSAITNTSNSKFEKASFHKRASELGFQVKSIKPDHHLFELAQFTKIERCIKTG